MISKTISSKFMIPSCIIRSADRIVDTPMFSFGKNRYTVLDLTWKIEMEWLDDDRTFFLGQKRDIMPMNNISVDWENECVSLDDLDIDSNLSNKQFLRIRKILSRHRRFFRKEKGLTHLVEHRIETDDAKPIHCKPYRFSHKKRTIVHEREKM